MLSNTQVTKILTLGIKKRSALNLYNQSSRKWKRSDSMSSPFRNKNIHTDFSWSALQTARLRQVESRYNWSRLKSWWQILTLRFHFNCIYRFHRLCVRHVAEHAHGTLLKGFLQRVSPRVNSWKRKKKGFLLKSKKKQRNMVLLYQKGTHWTSAVWSRSETIKIKWGDIMSWLN